MTAAPARELPDDWRELPALADRTQSAATRAAGADIEVSMRASGDPASGVFALNAAVDGSSGGSGFEEVPAALKAAAEKSGAVITDWSQSPGVASFAFQWRAFRGTARVRTTRNEGGDRLRATLLACFYNERQPSRSAQTCRTVMDTFEETP